MVALRSRTAERINLASGDKFRKDLKLSGLSGALLGWAGAVPWLVGLLVAYLLYLTTAVAVALHGRAPLRGHHPLGPALVAGTLLALAALAR